MSFFISKTAQSVPIHLIEAENISKWLKKQDAYTAQWVKTSGFTAEPGELLLLPNPKGQLAHVLFGISDSEESFLYTLSALPHKLPPHKAGYYLAETVGKAHATAYAIGWGLGCYEFHRYKSGKAAEYAKLAMPSHADAKEVKNTLDAVFLTRDLINIPANDLGPEELAREARKLATRFKATFKVIAGEELLKKNYPAIYAVGKASPRKPRLIDIRWGNKTHPLITLVGKGVCYDTGGLSLKPTSAMLNMKKDMGGAAHVLGLAQLIMTQKLPVRLRVLIPAVENSVAGNSYRPGDIIATRKGVSVEVGNTDAEGRIVLSDALAEACTEKPDLLIDFATLTGAARVALGPDLPAMFCNDDTTAQHLLDSAERAQDPLWRMPLWQPYKSMLASKAADINNNSTSGFAGCITAALFLQKFVEPKTAWIHIDTFGWMPHAKPGRPEGGEALGMRAAYDMIARRFGKKK